MAGAIRARLTPRLPAERLLLIAIALGKMLYEDATTAEAAGQSREEIARLSDPHDPFITSTAQTLRTGRYVPLSADGD